MKDSKKELIIDQFLAGRSITSLAFDLKESSYNVGDILREHMKGIYSAPLPKPKPERKPVSMCLDKKTKEIYTLFDDNTLWLTIHQIGIESVSSRTIMIADFKESKDWIE